MLANFYFKKTPTLIFGAGKILELPQAIKKYGTRLLLISGGKSFLSGKHWPILSEALKKEGFVWDIEQISGEPAPEDIDLITSRYSSKQIDAVVAIGGGSVLDGGKAISAMLVEKQPVQNFLEGVGTVVPSGKRLPLVTVPTTSGTGSEATANAVISKIGKDGFKKSLRHENYVPDLAIIDPELTVGCPRELTVSCGMDTFTQLVEAYLSTKGSPIADALALDGLRCVIRSLEKACIDGGDLTARTDMAYGSYLSGIVLANSGLGVVHGLASTIGGLFPIPHGVVCGTLMGAANRITLKQLQNNGTNQQALEKYANLGRLVSPTSQSDTIAQENFVSYVEELTNRLSIPLLGNYGISEDSVVAIVNGSGCKNNPVTLGKEEIKTIVRIRL